MKNTILKMETLTCPTCALKIEKALGKTQGVKSATVRFNSSSAEVRFDETITDIQKLKETVQKLGYEVLELKKTSDLFARFIMLLIYECDRGLCDR